MPTHYGRLYIETDGEAISALRRDAFLTQRELAARIGISTNFLAQLECGSKRGISVKTLRSLLKALGLKAKDVNKVIRYEKRDGHDARFMGEDDRLTAYERLLEDRAEQEADDAL